MSFMTFSPHKNHLSCHFSCLNPVLPRPVLPHPVPPPPAPMLKRNDSLRRGNAPTPSAAKTQRLPPPRKRNGSLRREAPRRHLAIASPPRSLRGRYVPSSRPTARAARGWRAPSPPAAAHRLHARTGSVPSSCVRDKGLGIRALYLIRIPHRGSLVGRWPFNPLHGLNPHYLIRIPYTD